MTRKERLRRAYFHEEMDRPAVYSREGFPSNDPTYDKLKKYLAENSELKFLWKLKETPYTTETSYEGYNEDFRRRKTILHTPAGNLESTSFESLKGQPGLHETYFLKTAEDAEKYLSLPPPEIIKETDSFFETGKKAGDTGIVNVSLGMNPAGTVVDLFGSELFAMTSIMERDLLYTLCERQMKIILKKLEFLAENKIGPYFSMLGEEYLVPPLHGPKDFYDFNVKYDKPIIDFIHNIGGRVHIHSHGSIRDVIHHFVEMGTDVLHPFEAPPSGNITAAEAKKAAGSKMCLEGNIQIAHMYEREPEDIRRQTEELIKTVFADKKGLIVSPSASPYIRGEGEKCFANYKAMIDTVLNYC